MRAFACSAESVAGFSFALLVACSLTAFAMARGVEPYYTFGWWYVVLNVGIPFFLVGASTSWAIVVLILVAANRLRKGWVAGMLVVFGCAGLMLHTSRLFVRDMVAGVCHDKPPWERRQD